MPDKHENREVNRAQEEFRDTRQDKRSGDASKHDVREAKEEVRDEKQEKRKGNNKND
jgi:hypothetical protein